MKRPFLFTLLILLASNCSAERINSESGNPPSHEIFDELLRSNVSGDQVDYRGFINSKEKFEKYLDLISENPPDRGKWSKKEQLTYWINAYNAFTIKLIIDNYPVESIQDLHPTIYIPLVRTVWHKKFFKIGEVEMNLDEIEHDILRKEFNEPRIHFAINCASFSCPPLRNEAFTADKIDKQLEEQAVTFVNDFGRNKISTNSADVSKIFSWFSKDFTKDGSLIQFLNKYSKVKLNEDAKIEYLDYDWSLNDKK
ncbi:DUF547 domain-containing protein [Fulvivirga sp.]|uniref:DUF547 domain-containing protein n=1 Tax=Fulvivirga sp. TaxID=1931237 RepID=UPI0032EC01B7